MSACPACGVDSVGGVGQPACPECWRAAPPSLRAELMKARQGRVTEPAAYAEAVAGWLLWCHDRRYGRGGDRE